MRGLASQNTCEKILNHVPLDAAIRRFCVCLPLRVMAIALDGSRDANSYERLRRRLRMNSNTSAVGVDRELEHVEGTSVWRVEKREAGCSATEQRLRTKKSLRRERVCVCREWKNDATLAAAGSSHGLAIFCSG